VKSRGLKRWEWVVLLVGAAGFAVFVGFELKNRLTLREEAERAAEERALARLREAEQAVEAWQAKCAAYQRKAEATSWRWSKERTTFEYCVKHNLHGHPVSEVNAAPPASNSLRGAAVFVQVGDVVYLACCCPLATGCTVVAYDLKERKQLWECALRGIGPTWHSKYWNHVNIEVDGDVILVFGAEANGRYIEYVDAKRGETIGHKKLPADSSLDY
jgi:hypothetical protein